MSGSTLTAAALAVGGRLPEMTLPAAPGGAPVQVRRQGRQATVLLGIHGGDCAVCRDYLRALHERREAIVDWDGRVLVVLQEDLAAAQRLRASLGLEFPVLADAESRLESAYGLAGGGMVIADQWGEIFHVGAGGAAEHSFPAPAEVAEWLRFVTIQCPECQGEAR